MKLLNDKERVFSSYLDGVERKYKIVRPSFAQGNKADLIYKKAFTDAIRAGVPTAAQLKDVMDTEFYLKVNQGIQQIDLDLAERTISLESCTDEKQGMEIVLALKELRARRFVEAVKLNVVYENTAETYAESLRNQYYVSELVCEMNGKKVFSSFEDFQTKQTDQLAQDALLNIMIFIARISDNYQMEFSENKWLLKNGVIDEDGNVIKKEVKVETEQGSNDKEQEVKVEETKV